MANQQLEALVYTNDRCVGCHKCISVCPVLTANKAIDEDGQNKIMVDGKQCIACGACFDACAHGARSYNDDTELFFADLKKEKRYHFYLLRLFWLIIRENMQQFSAVLNNLV